MKWLHNLLKGASLTGALFVFQACYGIQQGPLFEHGQAPMAFTLVSHETGLPVAGIRILQPKDTSLVDLREREIIVKLENFQ